MTRVPLMAAIFFWRLTSTPRADEDRNFTLVKSTDQLSAVAIVDQVVQLLAEAFDLAEVEEWRVPRC